ncbi:MAG: hypothetical protein DHS20C15_05490 [Planctomycetota bacterium]|nr:MAG: hypothetical protein DHS20C15_05490 [Planctomycetota bacterium]
MRLLTWNIHKGIGGIDRAYRIERTLEVLAHHNADVLLLQEVDQGVPRSRRHDQAALIAERLGYKHVAFAANVSLREGRYGNALLSRRDILHWENVDLSFPMKKKRAALHAVIEARLGRHRHRLHVWNLHLGLSGLERAWQLRKLLGSDSLRHLDARSRLVVGGDTNDWAGTLWPRVMRPAGFELASGRGRAALRSFPAAAPSGALDKFFLRGPLRRRRCHRSRLAVARKASDHLPLILDLDLDAP